MLNTLPDEDWAVLLQKIKAGRCLPFLGAGACYGALPLGGAIAEYWADAHGYPMEDRHDLIRVAQYLAVRFDREYPKNEILELFRQIRDRDFPDGRAPKFAEGLTAPNFKARDEPHGVLARLPLPVYMTTNYDDFMMQALRKREKQPRREMCRWNALVADEPSVFEEEPDYKPNAANPVVFHLHGHTRPESLVLTEDDYLDFLSSMISDANLLPPPVRAALARSSLLFVGYRLADWNFRVLLQRLRPSQGSTSVAVLTPPPGNSEELREKAKTYLGKYFGAMRMSVYWGTAREFSRDLLGRWEAAYPAD